MPKVIVILPAYNAEKTLEKTFRDIPKGKVDETILGDDGSRDRTVEITRSLGKERFNDGISNFKRCQRYAAL